MEWNQPLFEAFMAAVVGGILYAQHQLRRIEKKLAPKDGGGNARTEKPAQDLKRMKAHSDDEPCPYDLTPADEPADGEARRGGDEAPPIG